MENNLMPCPFCGGTEIRMDRVTFGHGDGGESVKCGTCGAEVPDDYIGRRALEKWNTRATETPNDRVEGRDAALSRRVPSHDGLCPDGGAE